jgi:hypothetical protein
MWNLLRQAILLYQIAQMSILFSCVTIMAEAMYLMQNISRKLIGRILLLLPF